MKKKFTAQQKATVALAALKGLKSRNELSTLFGVHPSQINSWSKMAEESLINIFTDKRGRAGKTDERLVNDLYRLVGQRDIELDWLKKSLNHFEP